MAYYDDEASEDAGEPVELYEFTAPTTAYRYTSGPVAVVYGGNTYSPAAGLERATVGTGSTNGGSSITVTMRAAESVVQVYGFATEPRTLRLRIYRTQTTSAETVTIWDGVVVAMAVRGHVAEIRSSSQVGVRLATQIPSLSVGGRCRHFLYDGRCRVVRATYVHTTTVSSFSGSTITVAGVGGNPDGWFANGGEIERDADGERRMIYAQVGAVLTISAPFQTLATSNAVTMWPGCDHTHRFFTDPTSGLPVVRGDCHLKFANAQNFGGHASVPNSNPFTLNIRLTRGSS